MRLDQWLVTQALARSRAQAVELIHSGVVWVGGRVETVPSRKVMAGVEVRLQSAGETPLLQSHQYVSRAAVKLRAGLDHFAIDPQGKVAVDLGTSTGGFCQVLLQAGVDKIYGIEIGSGQLAESLRGETRLELREKTNARNLVADDFAEPIELVVADLSFISLTLALPPILSIAEVGAEAVVLVKPQFEVGREFIGKNGIVKDRVAIEQATRRIEILFGEFGWRVLGTMDSPILGGSGNGEIVMGARR